MAFAGLRVVAAARFRYPRHVLPRKRRRAPREWSGRLARRIGWRRGRGVDTGRFRRRRGSASAQLSVALLFGPGPAEPLVG